MNQIYTDIRPYKNKTFANMLINATMGTLPAPATDIVDNDCKIDGLWEILEKCWDQKPASRTEMRIVVSNLNRL